MVTSATSKMKKHVRVQVRQQKENENVLQKMTDCVVHTKTANEASTLNEKTELMRQYFETLDVVKNAVKLRFDQDDLHILKVIERFILSAANNKCSETVDLVKDLNKYADIIKLNELTTEAQELHVYIKQYNNKKKKSNPSYTPVTNVTTISTVCDVMNGVSDSKESLPQIHKLLKLYLSMPLNSATAERTFSAMRRVKSWLRSTMSSNSLNNRMFSTIHKHRMDEVSAFDVAKEFVEVNEERMVHFGHFE